mgnify:CR=1 FL=1
MWQVAQEQQPPHSPAHDPLLELGRRDHAQRHAVADVEHRIEDRLFGDGRRLDMQHQVDGIAEAIVERGSDFEFHRL